MSDTNGSGAAGGIPFDERTCERYLFGELDREEQERFETSYFNDDAFFNRFMAVKDELLDLYSRNELDVEKRRRLEKHFSATAPRRKQLDASNDFIRSVTLIADRVAPPAVSSSAGEAKSVSFLETVKHFFSLPRLAAVGVLLLAVVAIGFWVITPADETDRAADPPYQPPPPAGSTEPNAAPPERSAADANSDRPNEDNTEPLPPQPSQKSEPDVALRPAPETPSNDAPPVESNNPEVPQLAPAPPPESRVAVVPKPEEPKQTEPRPESVGDVTESVTLASASRSITKTNTAKIGTATRSVAIRMVFGGEAYSSYAVRVTTLGGQTVWRASGLRTGMNDGAKSLSVTVPAGSLSRKDYIVTLEGRTSDGKLETIREYYLHVDRQ